MSESPLSYARDLHREAMPDISRGQAQRSPRMLMMELIAP